MKWYLRLALSIAVSMGAAVVVALGLTILDLYLTGHGYPSINRATIPAPWGGARFSPSDVIFLATIPVSGLAAWLLLRLIAKENAG